MSRQSSVLVWKPRENQERAQVKDFSKVRINLVQLSLRAPGVA